MHCGIQYDDFPCFQTLMASIFSFKIQLAQMSKRKQVQSSLNTFFRGKQDHESNMTPTMPTAAPIEETRKFQESWKEKYKWLHCDEKQNKMFCAFAGNFQMEKKNTHYSWGLEQITFKQAHEASEGHAMSSAAKRTSERAREERPLRTLLSALSRLKPKTAVELIKLLLLYTCMLQLLCVTGMKLLKYTYHGVYCYVSLKGF